MLSDIIFGSAGAPVPVEAARRSSRSADRTPSGGTAPNLRPGFPGPLPDLPGVNLLGEFDESRRQGRTAPPGVDVDNVRRVGDNLAPGGKAEDGETLTEALVREMREETGVQVEAGRMLYVCDHVSAHVFYLTFEACRAGGQVGAVESRKDTRPIRAVRFVKLADLGSLGFSKRFTQLRQAGFPDTGIYAGPKAMIGL